MTGWVDGTELPDEPPHTRDMTPIAMTPTGWITPDTAMAMLAVPTPPPDDPDQVTQDKDDPSKYWVMEDGLQVGFYVLMEQDTFLCFAADKSPEWRQLGVVTNEGDAIDLILDPPEISIGKK